MKKLLFIYACAICGMSNAQTIISASPTSAYRGDTLVMNITTSVTVSNPNHFFLVNGSNTEKPWSAYNTSGNNYEVTYYIKEYAPLGNYTLYLGSNSFSTPIVISAQNYPQAFNYTSVKSLNININNENYEGIKRIVADKQGNIYYTGTFSDTAILGSTTIVSAGNRDGFIAKYNNFGSLVWVKTIGGEQNDGLTSVNIFNDTVIYICGVVICDSTLKYNNFSPLIYSARNSASQDGILAKLDTAGNIKWYAFQGSKKTDATNDMDISNDGNIYITGYLQGDLMIYSYDTCFTYVYSSNLTDSVQLCAFSEDYYGAYIAKYSPAGHVIWAKRQTIEYSNYGGGNSVAIKLTTNNNIVVIISTQLQVKYDNTACNNGSYGNPHYAILKTDSAGNRLWCDEDGNFTNIFTLGIDKWDNVYFPFTFHVSNDDVYLVKYSSTGSKIWTKRIHNNPANIGNYSSVTDTLGNTYVAYSYEDEWASGKMSIVLKKINSFGNVSAITFPYPYTADNINLPTALALNNAQSKIYLAGIYKGSQTFGTTNINTSTPKVFVSELNYYFFSGIENINVSSSSVFIFPNPVSGSFFVQTSLTNSQLDIVNPLGERIFSTQIKSDKTEIYLGNQKNGIYFIRLIKDNKINATNKLVIIN